MAKGDSPSVYDRISLTINGCQEFFGLSKKAKKFIKQFDNKLKVKPFKFKAPLLDE